VAAYAAALLSIPWAAATVLLGAPELALLSIPVWIAGVLVNAVAYLIIWLRPRAEWGWKARFVANVGPAPIFRIYDDVLSVREVGGGRIRTSRYSYDEVIDVRVERSSWSRFSHGGTLRVLVKEGSGNREIVAPSLIAKKVAGEIDEAKRLFLARAAVAQEIEPV
jgi:hypothetical protein